MTNRPALRIPFNKPFLSGKETAYIHEAVEAGQVSGNGPFTKKCHAFFQERYGFPHCLLTTSCTDALEMASLLIGLEPGDEVIVPAYTFVSTANAFVLRGAKVVFADSGPHLPGMDATRLAPLITDKTKAIVVVHYAGVACDMDPIMELAAEHNLYVIEDAAHALDATYKGRPLGSIGHLASFSFHETKNLISGEGGMLVVNHEPFQKRAEILWEKGTNRAAFFRGEVDKYTWVDLGSSFLPSDIIAAFLFAQLERVEQIQETRCAIWSRYHTGLSPLETQGHLTLPVIPDWASNNGNLFYFTVHNLAVRDGLLSYLREQGIQAVFHYLPLHRSPFYASNHGDRPLPHCERYADTLIRLPFYNELTVADQHTVIEAITSFFTS